MYTPTEKTVQFVLQTLMQQILSLTVIVTENPQLHRICYQYSGPPKLSMEIQQLL